MGMRPARRDPGGRVGAAVLDPISVQFSLQMARVALAKQYIQPAAPAELEEFKAVIMVAEGEAGRRQLLADAPPDFSEAPVAVCIRAEFGRHAADGDVAAIP